MKKFKKGKKLFIIFSIICLIGLVLINLYLTLIRTKTSSRASINRFPKKYIGGNPTTITKWPFVVMITWAHKSRLLNGEYDLIRSRRCTGSIINKRWILTAGHCVGNVTDNDVGVVVGVDDIVNQKVGETPNVKYLTPKRIVRHKNYEVKSIQDNGIMALADIALIEVAVDMNLQPVTLAKTVNYKSSSAYGIGWGFFKSKDGDITLPKQLQELQVIPYKKGGQYAFTDAFFGTIFRDKILIDYLGKDESASFGDSGGPLVFLNEKTNTYELVGVYSSGTQYTDITKYLKWIGENVNE